MNKAANADVQDIAKAGHVAGGLDDEFLAGLLAAMTTEMERNGLGRRELSVPSSARRATLRKDPFDGSEALYVDWSLAIGRPAGNVLLHANGMAFAEMDVLLPHPRKPQWFVEAVTAWGQRGSVKAELRLLAMPG